MGGEAARPLHYFRILRPRGVEAWLLVHERTRDELKQIVPEHADRIHFVPDTKLHRFLWWLSKPLPHSVYLVTTGALSHLWTQILQRRKAKRLVREHGIDLVHEPIPISPKQPSMMFGVGAPVIIGPLNGGMTYPPAFAYMESTLVRSSLWLSRFVANLMNRLIPGKLLADAIIVSNPRTRDALPSGRKGRVVELVANAVDMATWKPSARYAKLFGEANDGDASNPVSADPTAPVRFAFLGRLVDFKMVDLLLEAFKPVAQRFPNATLDIIGDGPDKPALEAHARRLSLQDRVTFAGWMSPRQSAARLGEADVLVFPSLRECGGAVVMEAMAVGLPVIAANWGGPADYVGADGSGVLVEPATKGSFVRDLTEQMSKLAASPEARIAMSKAARKRALTVFDWEARVDRLLEIYCDTLARQSPQPQACRAGEPRVAAM
jgi:glycosyltransferase involved in cell wall biosynthesis